MVNKKLNRDEKKEELVKYRYMVLATLDYYIVIVDPKASGLQNPLLRPAAIS